MKKCCENCTKKENCTRETGVIFGFCNVDFEPIQMQEKNEKNVISFTIRTERKHWTASDLMQDYAKEHSDCKVETTKHFETVMTINGKRYIYDHVKSIYENPITVYLKEY